MYRFGKLRGSQAVKTQINAQTYHNQTLKTKNKEKNLESSQRKMRTSFKGGK